MRRRTPLLNYKDRIDTGVLLPRGQCNPVSLCEPYNPFGVWSRSAQADSALGLVYLSLWLVQMKPLWGLVQECAGRLRSWTIRIGLTLGYYYQGDSAIRFRFANHVTPLGSSPRVRRRTPLLDLCTWAFGSYKIWLILGYYYQGDSTISFALRTVKPLWGLIFSLRLRIVNFRTMLSFESFELLQGNNNLQY